jgi:hypothetical protein
MVLKLFLSRVKLNTVTNLLSNLCILDPFQIMTLLN